MIFCKMDLKYQNHNNHMSVLISSIYFSPVKSLSFINIESCEVKKNLGILNDRKFAFSRIINSERALSELMILEKANFLSFKIPKFFLTSHDSIFIKDKDFTGLKYIDEIKTLI